MSALWKMFDVDGQEEPYLDNPRLFILNKKKGKTKMRRARRRTRRVARRRNAYLPAVVNRPRRRRRTRSARRTAFAANPRRSRRRAVVHRARRRGFRRNPPDILGFNLKDVAIAGAAVVLCPLVEKQLMAILPASMAGTTSGRWAVKVGSVVAIGFGAKKVLGGKFGNLALIALGANIIADAVHEFAPTLIPGSGVSAYLNGGLGSYSNRGLRGGPMAMPGTYVGLSPRMLEPASFQTDPFKPAW